MFSCLKFLCQIAEPPVSFSVYCGGQQECIPDAELVAAAVVSDQLPLSCLGADLQTYDEEFIASTTIGP